MGSPDRGAERKGGAMTTAEIMSGAGLWSGAAEAARRKLGLGLEYTVFALSLCGCCKAGWCSMRVGLGIRQAGMFGPSNVWTHKRYVTVSSEMPAAAYD